MKYPDIYLENCRKMKQLNRKKYEETIKRVRAAYSEQTAKDLQMSADGWLDWTNFWEEKENEAKNANLGGVENGS